MDVSSLIQMVREREPLWNRQHPHYKDRELAAMLWGQVAQYLNVDVETARYKWRGLRDTYRVQLRKLKRPGSRSVKQQVVSSRWEYFNDMSFVKDHIYLDVNSRHYKTKRLKIDSADFDEHEDDTYFEGEEGSGDDEFQNLSELCETEITEGDETFDEKFHASDTLKTEENGDSLEDEKLSSNDSTSENQIKNGKDYFFQNGLSSLEDDNFCFLLSILPQLRSLPNKRNLYVRIKMQELLLKEVISLQKEA